MKKRFAGKSSACLASGRSVRLGDMVDMSASEWAKNAHVIDQFVDVEGAPARPAPAPKKSDKE